MIGDAINMRKSNAIIKVDLAENWMKAVNYIPDCFTIIVYEFQDASPKIKLGDGVHRLADLPFLIQNEDDKEIEDGVLKS